MTVSPTPDYSPQAETAPGLIRNALWLCVLRIAATTKHERANFEAIARLLENALAKLDGREAAHPQGEK